MMNPFITQHHMNHDNDQGLTIALTEYDVLFGRGKPFQLYPGNVRLRELVSVHRPRYFAAKRFEKACIANEIVGLIKNDSKNPGRFLKRASCDNDWLWMTASDEEAVEKVCHMLREKKAINSSSTIRKTASKTTKRQSTTILPKISIIAKKKEQKPEIALSPSTVPTSLVSQIRCASSQPQTKKPDSSLRNSFTSSLNPTEATISIHDAAAIALLNPTLRASVESLLYSSRPVQVQQALPDLFAQNFLPQEKHRVQMPPTSSIASLQMKLALLNEVTSLQGSLLRSL